MPAQPIQLALFDDAPAAEVAAPIPPPQAAAAGASRRPHALPKVLIAKGVSGPLSVAACTDFATALQRRLGERLGRLVFTETRTVLVSFRVMEPLANPPRLAIRIHRRFAEAPPEVAQAIARFVEGPDAARRAARAALRAWAAQHGPLASTAPSRPPVLEARGTIHDLAVISREALERYFPDLGTVQIGWGRARSGRKRARTIRLGSWNQRQGAVRIHPALDQRWVPRFVVEVIVHHELLHAALPPRTGRGRRQVHHADFRAREAEHPRHLDAQRWIRDNIDRLLRPRRR